MQVRRNMGYRFKTIEDVLVYHADFAGRGFWFGFSDSKNKIYANLVIHNSDYEMPTETWLESELKKAQDEYDAQEYARNRAAEYPSTGDQLDYIFHNGVAKWKTDIIEPVKTKYPKPS